MSPVPISREEDGVLFWIPTFPPFVTMKYAPFAEVEEPITNAGPVMPFGLRDNMPHGEVVPIPKLPVESNLPFSAPEMLKLMVLEEPNKPVLIVPKLKPTTPALPAVPKLIPGIDHSEPPALLMVLSPIFKYPLLLSPICTPGLAVDAITRFETNVDEAFEIKPLVKVCRLLQMFVVVVPKARAIVRSAERSPPPVTG